jgi:hypothetical protein
MSEGRKLESRGGCCAEDALDGGEDWASCALAICDEGFGVARGRGREGREGRCAFSREEVLSESAEIVESSEMSMNRGFVHKVDGPCGSSVENGKLLAVRSFPRG